MILKSLNIKNFTVFQHLDVQFGSGMNVVVGANGAGKSHLLKLAYSAVAAGYQASQEQKTSLEEFEHVLQEKMMDVFRADGLKNLIYMRTHPTEAEISVSFENPAQDYSFYFPFPHESHQESSISVTEVPGDFPSDSPVFMPTREILSIMPAFAKFHREKSLLLDGTYFDLSFLVEQNLATKLDPAIKRIIKRLNTLLQGKVVQNGGRFYLKQKSGFELEMPLVAEGLRKIAMLCRLLENSAINPGALVLWDEPEANLNPLLMTELADILVQLAGLNLQIILATHSLFLLREIHICMAKAKQEGRYFALSSHVGKVTLSQANSIDDIEPISALEADLSQTDRYMSLEN